MYQCSKLFVILFNDLRTLWPQWPKSTAMSSVYSLLPEEMCSYEYLLLTHHNFFSTFIVVFPTDRTTDFAFVIEHLLVKVLRTFFPLIRSHAICHYLLGLHIFLVDSHGKLLHVWNTFIINSRVYSKLC